MASVESVLVAGLMHLFLRFTIFIEPQTKLNTPGPSLPSFIVCVALMDIIYDSRIVPLSIYRAPRGIKCICECVVAILLLEVGMLIVWNTLEFSVYIIIQTLLLGLNLISVDNYHRHETLIIGVFTFSLAFAVLAITSIATHHSYDFYHRYFAPKTNVSIRVDNTVNFLNRTHHYKRLKMKQAMNKYNTPMWESYFEKHM